jgi:hypothetical protein
MYSTEGREVAIVAVLGTGDMWRRLRKYEKFKKRGLGFFTISYPVKTRVFCCIHLQQILRITRTREVVRLIPTLCRSVLLLLASWSTLSGSSKLQPTSRVGPPLQQYIIHKHHHHQKFIIENNFPYNNTYTLYHFLHAIMKRDIHGALVVQFSAPSPCSSHSGRHFIRLSSPLRSHEKNKIMAVT